MYLFLKNKFNSKKSILFMLYLAVFIFSFSSAIADAEISVQQKGLVCYFTFDAGGGRVVKDRSGNKHNGTMFGEPVWVKGVSGEALNFQKGGIEFPHGNVFRIKNRLTVSFWSKNNDRSLSGMTAIFSIRDSYRYLLTIFQGYDANHFLLMMATANGAKKARHYFRVYNSSRFNFYTFVFQGTSAKFYENGKFIQSWESGILLKNIFSSATRTFIGAAWNPSAKNRYFNGSIDEFKIFNSALSAGDIKSMYERHAAGMKVINLCRNSSFEITTLKDWPDFWNSTQGRFRYLDNKYQISVDGKEAHSGNKSAVLDIKAPFNPGNYGKRFPFGLTQLFMNPVIGKYRLSAYLKSKPAGLEIKMGPYNKRVFTLTDKWKRYSVVFDVKGGKRFRIGFIPAGFSRKGKIYLDDVMLTSGDKIEKYASAGADKRYLESSLKKSEVTSIAVKTVDFRRAVLKNGVAPVIDGKIGKDEWSSALNPGPFHRLGLQKTELNTIAKVSYDNKNIYFALKCSEPGLSSRANIRLKRDSDKIWRQSVVEIFIDPNESDDIYYHLVISASGSKWDAKVIFQDGAKGSKDFYYQDLKKWNGDWQASTKITKTGWSVEVRIPWYNFSAELNKPSQFRFNLTREVPARKEVMSLAPGLKRFNEPWRFIRVKNFNVDWSQYGVFLKGIAIRPLLPIGNYALNLSILNRTTVNQTVQLFYKHSAANKFISLGAIPVKKKALTQFRKVIGKIEPGKPFIFKLTAGQQIVSLQYFEAEPAKPVVITVPVVTTVGQDLNIFYKINLPEAEITANRIKLKVDLKKGNNILIKNDFKIQKAEGRVKIITANLPGGSFVLEFNLQYQNRNIYTISQEILFKEKSTGRQGTPGSAIFYDPVKQAMFLNGKPFLPIAFVTLGLVIPRYGSFENMDTRLLDMSSHGINTIIWFIDPDEVLLSPREVKAKLKSLKNIGKIKLILNFSHFIRGRDGLTEEKIDRIKSWIKELKGLKAIIAWQMIDEPVHSLPGQDPASLFKLYNIIKEIDPTRPVYVNFGTYGILGKHRYKYREAEDSSDFISFDYYPWPLSPTERPMGKLLAYLDECHQWASRLNKPLFSYVGLNDFATPNLIRLPRPVELRALVFLNLIEGVRGLLYFTGAPASQLLYTEMAKINRQVVELRPVFFAPARGIKLKINTEMVKAFIGKINNRIFLVAVNYGDKDLSVSFALGTKKLFSPKVKVLFENRQIKQNNNVIKDNFGAYEVHVYELEVIK